MSNRSIECRRHVELEATLHLALEALGKAIRYGSFHGADWAFNEIEEAIHVIKEALQSNEQGQKPVEFDVKCDACKGNGRDWNDNNYKCVACKGFGFVEKLLYMSPPPVAEPHKCTAAEGEDTRRAWEGLSVFEINDLVTNTEHGLHELVERTEKLLKEKNT